MDTKIRLNIKIFKLFLICYLYEINLAPNFLWNKNSSYFIIRSFSWLYELHTAYNQSSWNFYKEKILKFLYISQTN